jgi:hypothetical protein
MVKIGVEYTKAPYHLMNPHYGYMKSKSGRSKLLITFMPWCQPVISV